MTLEYLQNSPLPSVGEDEGEGETKLVLSTPTLALPHQGGRNSCCFHHLRVTNPS